MMEIRISLPLRLVSEPNARGHWGARHRRAQEQRALVRMRLAGERGWAPHLPVRVTITRIGPRVLDGDNLQAACKAVRDGIADSLGVDDGNPAVAWSYDQRRGKPGEYGVELHVRETGGAV